MESLKSRCDHPTAEMLYHSLRKEQPNISLGTVYRNLTLLEEQGQLLRIPMTGGPDRFDGDLSNHHHLQCRCCDEIIDIFGGDWVDMEAARQSARESGAEVLEVRLFFAGLCPGCAAQAKEN